MVEIGVELDMVHILSRLGSKVEQTVSSVGGQGYISKETVLRTHLKLEVSELRSDTDG